MTRIVILVMLATAPEGPAAEKIEAVEEIVEVVDLDALDEPEYLPPAPTVTQTISRLHAALVHLPIGALMVVVFLELVALVRRRQELHRAAWLVLAAALVAFVPSAITGWMQLSSMGEGAPRLEPTLDHRNVMLSASALLLAALALGRGTPAGSRAWAYRGLVAVATALVTVGGHLGGKLVFGEHYLPF